MLRCRSPKVPTDAYSAIRIFFLTLNRKTLITDIGSIRLSGTRMIKAMPSLFRNRTGDCAPFSVISSMWFFPMPNSFCPVDERWRGARLSWTSCSVLLSGRIASAWPMNSGSGNVRALSVRVAEGSGAAAASGVCACDRMQAQQASNRMRVFFMRMERWNEFVYFSRKDNAKTPVPVFGG